MLPNSILKNTGKRKSLDSILAKKTSDLLRRSATGTWVDDAGVIKGTAAWIEKNSACRTRVMSSVDTLEKNARAPLDSNARDYDKYTDEIARDLMQQSPLSGLNNQIKDYFAAIFEARAGNEDLTKGLVIQAMRGNAEKPLQIIIYRAILAGMASVKNMRELFDDIVALAVKDTAFTGVLDKLFEETEAKRPKDPNEITRKDYDAFLADFLPKAGKIIRNLESRIVGARCSWDTAKQLREEQYIVALFMSDLPSESNIKNAESNFASLKKISTPGNFQFKKDNRAFGLFSHFHENTVMYLNKAVAEMAKYYGNIDSRCSNIITGLEITRDVSFTTLEVLATIYTGPSGAIAVQGGVAALKSASTETGKALAGTSEGPGAAIGNVIFDTVVASAAGAIFGQVGQKAAASVANKLAPTLAAKCAPFLKKKAGEMILKWLQNYGKDIFKSTLEGLYKYHKGKVTWEKFIDGLSKDLWLKMPMAAAGAVLDGKFAEASYPAFCKKVAVVPFSEYQTTMSLAPIGPVVEKLLSTAVDHASAKAKSPQEFDQILIDSVVNDKKFQELLEKLSQPKK